MEEAVFLQISHRFWNKGGGLAVSSRGASGGLGSLWNASKFLLLKSIPNTHWLFLKLQLVESKDEISLLNVYVQQMQEKRSLVGTPSEILLKLRILKTPS